jgi:hypothetical protein
VFSDVRVAQSFIFYIVFCGSLFVFSEETTGVISCRKPKKAENKKTKNEKKKR